MGTPPEEREVAWPGGWRLPQQGDHVVFEPGWGSFVEFVSFDIDRMAVRLMLR